MVAAALPVTDDQRLELQRIAGSSVLPHRQVVQAQALLWAADGVANEEITSRWRVDSDTVRRWRNRFTDKGIGGVGGIRKGRGKHRRTRHTAQLHPLLISHRQRRSHHQTILSKHQTNSPTDH